MITPHLLAATMASVVLLLVVLELVRRRRLFERYAILWLASAIALIALSIWGGLLNIIADILGIQAPPNALFAIALGFVLVLLLHFSVAVSRLSDQSKVLAQRLALAEERLRELAAQAEGTPEQDALPGPRALPHAEHSAEAHEGRSVGAAASVRRPPS